VYALALHPTLDLVLTGGRDATCRVWDMRTKVQVFALSGHTNTVAAILSQPTDPQVRLGPGGAWERGSELTARARLAQRPHDFHSAAAAATGPGRH
jgi:pleiotropic regulator 1